MCVCYLWCVCVCECDFKRLVVSVSSLQWIEDLPTVFPISHPKSAGTYSNYPGRYCRCRDCFHWGRIYGPKGHTEFKGYKL